MQRRGDCSWSGVSRSTAARPTRCAPIPPRAGSIGSRSRSRSPSLRAASSRTSTTLFVASRRAATDDARPAVARWACSASVPSPRHVSACRAAAGARSSIEGGLRPPPGAFRTPIRNPGSLLRGLSRAPSRPISRGFMVFAYPLGDALYLNLTSACTLACTFCPKIRDDDWVVGGFDLKLARAPSADEVWRSAQEVGLEGRSEVVFTG